MHFGALIRNHHPVGKYSRLSLQMLPVSTNMCLKSPGAKGSPHFERRKLKRALRRSRRNSAPSGGRMHARKHAQIRLPLQFSALLAALPNHPSLSPTARYLLPPALAAPPQQDPDPKFSATSTLSSAGELWSLSQICGELPHRTERRY